MNRQSAVDLHELRTLRERFTAADNTGDADAMLQLVADDIVILHPHCGVFEGRDAAGTFIRQVLREVHDEFEKHARYTTIEIMVGGDVAVERGHFAQVLFPKNGGVLTNEVGMYLWVYTRSSDRRWKLARIAGSITTPEEAPNREHSSHEEATHGGGNSAV